MLFVPGRRVYCWMVYQSSVCSRLHPLTFGHRAPSNTMKWADASIVPGLFPFASPRAFFAHLALTTYVKYVTARCLISYASVPLTPSCFLFRQGNRHHHSCCHRAPGLSGDIIMPCMQGRESGFPHSCALDEEPAHAVAGIWTSVARCRSHRQAASSPRK